MILEPPKLVLQTRRLCAGADAALHARGKHDFDCLRLSAHLLACLLDGRTRRGLTFVCFCSSRTTERHFIFSPSFLSYTYPLALFQSFCLSFTTSLLLHPGIQSPYSTSIPSKNGLRPLEQVRLLGPHLLPPRRFQSLPLLHPAPAPLLSLWERAHDVFRAWRRRPRNDARSF